jgi:DNA-binding LytR/AlgR family response regulator
LEKAINRCLADTATPSVSEALPAQTLAKEDDFLFFKTDRTFLKILLNDIYFVEAYGNYSKVYLQDRIVLVSDKISTIAEQLPDDFIRVHKSYIAAWSKMEKIENHQILIRQINVPIGDTFRKPFFERFNKRN